MIAAKLKLGVDKLVLSIPSPELHRGRNPPAASEQKAVVAQSSKNISQPISQAVVLGKNEKFLFEHLPLTPFIEEELNKRDEAKALGVPVKHLKQSNQYQDTFNMKVIENELISNPLKSQKQPL
jgi:hypothetical protein